MSLLDVNALVALAWDSHVHHEAARRWFAGHAGEGWATCTVTESGFVRVSSNPAVLPHAIGVEAARGVLAAMRRSGRHRFLASDVSFTDPDVPPVARHADVTDAVLLTLARRNGMRLVTFDRRLERLAGSEGLEVLRPSG